MDSVRAKASARKRKRESELLNPILSASYPFLSAGLEWTRPYDLMYVSFVLVIFGIVLRTRFSTIAPASPL